MTSPEPTTTRDPGPSATALPERYERLSKAFDALSETLRHTEAWARDEQQKRYAVEEKLVAERSSLAFGQQQLDEARERLLLAERALEDQGHRDQLRDDVVRAAVRAHALTGHNLPDWLECNARPPESCWWVQHDTALKHLDASSPREGG